MVSANHGRFRRRRVTERLMGDLPEPAGAGVADPAAVHGDRRALVDALAALPSGQRAAVVLRYWMDMTETEAAAVLGCSVGNVKPLGHRPGWACG